MRKLPIWNLTTKRPAFYDMESLTAVEQTAKIYGAMQELIDEYNTFATELNKSIEEFEKGTNQDLECFKTEMTTLIENYIKSIDMKISQDLTKVIAEMIDDGTLDEGVLEVFDHLDTRVQTLENTDYVLKYQDGTENLILEKVINGGA